MDQVHVIRHKVRVEGLSIRRVAREVGISRKTVRRYLQEETPIGVRRATPRSKPVLEAVGPRLEALLSDSARWTGGKQRLTAARLHELVRAEGLEVGATVVKEFVREWRRKRREVFVPLVYRPGELAEVDFFEVLVEVGGARRKAFLFVMRLMFSGRDFVWLYDRQDQVSFLDGHVRAFAHFGFVPQRIAYDNLRPAVRRLLRGSLRELTERFAALVTHYVFEPCFARPCTGHDKGGVEARGKAIRHQHLVPIPAGDDLTVIAAALVERVDAKFFASERAQQLDAEREFALQLPACAFDPRATHLVVVAPRSLVRIEGAYYSVPTAWTGLTVIARVAPGLVEIVGSEGTQLLVGIRRDRGRAGEPWVRHAQFAMHPGTDAAVLASVDLDLETHRLRRQARTREAVDQRRSLLGAFAGRLAEPRIEYLPDRIEHGPDRACGRLHQVDVLRVPTGRRQQQLLQRGPAAEHHGAGDRRPRVEFDQRAADHEILLDLGVGRPWCPRAPRGDVGARDHWSTWSFQFGITSQRGCGLTRFQDAPRSARAIHQWLASVKEIPECHTFGRGLAQTRARIREALVLWEGRKAASAELREILPLPAAAKKVIEECEELNTRWEQLAKQREGVVASLQRESWSARDIADVLGLSHQRVSQVSPQKRKRQRRTASKGKRLIAARGTTSK